MTNNKPKIIIPDTWMGKSIDGSMKSILQEDTPLIEPQTTLIQTPKNNSQYSILGGDFGKTILEEYKRIVKSDYQNSYLNIFKYEDGVVKGSSPFAVVLMNKVLRSHNFRTANQADLEKIIQDETLGVDSLKGTYEDSALVLRSKRKPHSYLARNLMSQLKARNQKQEIPIMIPLYGLDLVNNIFAPEGLSFNLRDNTEIIYAPILKERHFLDIMAEIFFYQTDENGLPKDNGKGNRILHTINSGLSGLRLGRYLNLSAEYLSLTDSDPSGRIVLVKT